MIQIGTRSALPDLVPALMNELPGQHIFIAAACSSAPSVLSCSGHEGSDQGLHVHRQPPRRALQPVQVEFTALETPSLPAREMRELELKEYKRQIQV